MKFELRIKEEKLWFIPIACFNPFTLILFLMLMLLSMCGMVKIIPKEKGQHC